MAPLNTQNSIKTRGSYLEYLPAVYRDDKFMGQLLLIFESILEPVENTADNLALCLDPRITPDPLLPWPASWLDLALNPILSIPCR